jgi:hypothetical protein
MKTIVVCAALAFALRAWGQQTTTYDTGAGHAQPLIPTTQSQLPNALSQMAITSDYYAEPKVLVLHVLNNSGKDITGYTMIIRHKTPDGTLGKGGWSETTSDMLSVLITAQMAKNPTASERIRQQEIGNDSFPTSAGTGIFLAGETRDMTLTGINSGSELDVTAGVVFYTDATYEQNDDDAFKRLLAIRQGQLQQMKDANDLIRNALADTTNRHPVAAVLTELNKRRVEAMDKPNQGFLMDLGPLRYLQQPAYGERKSTTERERLTEYVEEEEKRVELMTPHCHLEITFSQDKN